MNATLIFRNRQRTRRIRVSLLRRIAEALLRDEFRVMEFELCLHFVGSTEMAELNQRFLGHEGSTDVLTFDYRDEARPSRILKGEIFISVPDAIAQARQFKTSWQSELVRYVIHGLLHLRGYDDADPAARRKMKSREDRLLRSMHARFPLRQIARL